MDIIGTFSIVGFPLSLSRFPTRINKKGTNTYHNLILPKVMHSSAKIPGQYDGNLDDFVILLSNAQYNEYSTEYTNNVITIAANIDQ